MEHIIHDESNNSKEVKLCKIRIHLYLSKLAWWPQGRKGWLRKSGLWPPETEVSISVPPGLDVHMKIKTLAKFPK